jgi:phenylacetate-CoA ligase
MSRARRGLMSARLLALAAVERTVPRWPAAWITAAQNRRVRSIVQHAYATVPFYRQALDERDLTPADVRTVADLEQLPLIDGTLVRDRPDLFLSSRYDERQRHLFHTSGGLSLTQKTIAWDEAALLRRLAHEERDRAIVSQLAGRGWGQRQLFILPARTMSLQRRRLWDQHVLLPRGWASRRVVAPDLPPVAIAAALDEFRPDVVFSYGSFAEQFFRRLADTGQRPALPRVWVYNSDTLSPTGRRLIEQQFGVRVYATYQAAETGRLGFECERACGYHLNVDLCALRLIDDAGRAVPPGASGEVVISNLHNRGMVLLNYRIGDRGVLDPTLCLCGRTLPRLARLEGRATEVLVLSDGERLPALVLEFTLEDVLVRTLQNQIVQHRPGVVTWRVVPAGGVDPAAFERRLVAETHRRLGDRLAVTVAFVDAIALTPAGKQLRLIDEADEVVTTRPGARP